MIARRSIGMLALLAMVHFIIAGTAWACASAHTEAPAHAGCTPAQTSSHSSSGAADHASEPPCCTALSSCAATALATRTVAVDVAEPMVIVASAFAERAPRADAPAPEPPPPKA